ncbi:CBASS cGAMP-activated phospholipase [Sulfurovum sp.]|uniref:CBASS cGAMP-activated phospholipase n=1 Tax=Sulfurovum sp. TaxID=1969726 RepID=UPI002A36D87C|nr:CBASS cGAMP-activated phospholipase [Sulfurovum sp.]MDY0402429.1 CBASS cGAMP-activated phospholipase [Sulfurovum sp.]
MSKNFRILSLDGGGIRGVYTAHILKRIQEDTGIRLSDYFDLITGTSTGAILAAALAMDKDINEVIELYKQEGHNIFSSKFCPIKKYLGISIPFIPCLNKGIFTRKYSQKILKEQLENIFGDATMSDTNANLMLFATDIANATPHVFKSPYDPEFTRDRGVKLCDAVLASTSAPVYFNPYLLDGKYLLADGGLWCNNPSICAVAEAKNRFKKNHDEVELLSIGTIESKSYFEIKRNNHFLKKRFWGLIGWGTKVIDITLNLQSMVSHHNTDFLNLGKYLRINTKEGYQVPMDDVSMIDDFISKADKEYTYRSKEIMDFFTNKETK